MRRCHCPACVFSTNKVHSLPRSPFLSFKEQDANRRENSCDRDCDECSNGPTVRTSSVIEKAAPNICSRSHPTAQERALHLVLCESGQRESSDCLPDGELLRRSWAFTNCASGTTAHGRVLLDRSPRGAR